MTPREEPADAVLAGRAAQGDERAFAILVHRHKEPLYRLLRRYTGDPQDAYEATHEAFIAAWAALKRYDPARPFLPWLRMIAINKARDRTRRAALRRLVFGADGLDDRALDRPDPAAPADQTAMDAQDMARLDAAIARLPGGLKEALLLAAFEGCSQQEAAQILGVSVRTIETRAYRARKILAQTLDPDLRPSA